MNNDLYINLKGANTAMVREYVTPDFDVTVYEIEDVITLSIGDGGLDGGSEGWGG